MPKIAIVTGASRGIGKAVARRLARDGFAVVVNYASNTMEADATVAEIQSAGGQAIAVQADVSKSGDVERLFERTRETFGRLDVLVNNAGVFKIFPFEQMTEAEFHRIFNINVLGLMLVTKEALGHFGPEGGSVINIGAAVTELLLPNAAIYGASKGAVDVLTGILSKELARRKIRVNSINPGAVETEGWLTLGVKGTPLGDELLAQTPLGRVGQPDDIAKVAVFLASSDSGWLTGEVMLASGGQR